MTKEITIQQPIYTKDGGIINVEVKEKNKEKEITKLAKLWYQIVGLDYHKDRDCHWYINKVWSYGEPPKYSVEHYGYVFHEDINEEFETYEMAENYLGEVLKEAINRRKNWAKDVVKYPEKYESDWVGEGYNLGNAKKILEILKDKK